MEIEDPLSGIPDGQIAGQIVAAQRRINLVYGAELTQIRLDSLLLAIKERKDKIGKKKQLDRIDKQIDKLKLKLITTTNKDRKQELEKSISDLKSRKTLIEQIAAKSLTKDRKLKSMKKQLDRIKRVNNKRSELLGDEVEIASVDGGTEQSSTKALKEFVDNKIQEGNEKAAFEAQETIKNTSLLPGKNS